MSDSTPSQPAPEPDPNRSDSTQPGSTQPGSTQPGSTQPGSTPPDAAQPIVSATPDAPTEPSNPSAPAPSAPSAPAAPHEPGPPVAPPIPPAATAAEAPGSGHAGSVAANPRKRYGAPGIIAALAIGALVGGVSGAGVYAVATNNAASPSVQGPRATNITVNDPGNATTITAVAASAAPSVVTVLVSGQQESGTGSGVILSNDGYVLTNAHVATLSGATGNPTIKVETSDGRLFNAKLVGSDPIADIAVVKIDAAGVEFQPAKFADSGKLNVGDTVVAVGAPLGLANTVTSGIISALNRSITVASSAVPSSPSDQAPGNGNKDNNGNGPFGFWEFNNGPQSGSQAATSTIALPVIQTDAAINPGNSGGALLDSNGRVIGINVAIASTGSSSQSTAGSIGVGFAIPANVAKRISDDLIKDGKASHGLLGASVADVTDTNITSSSTVGASIQDVTPGGAADKAGLQKGDVVISLDGLPITGKTDLTAQVRALAGGSKAELVYVRDGKSVTVTVTLGTL